MKLTRYEEATAMPEVCYGAPNLYFLFASMGLFNLKQEAEMVYIIPRSWTSGAYFKSFREYLLNEWIRIHDIISFTDKCYGVTYAENSRETFRKQAIHHFMNAALIENNGLATNSPNFRYRITDEALCLLKRYKSKQWNASLKRFMAYHESLVDMYASKKKMTMMPDHMIHLNGDKFLGPR